MSFGLSRKRTLDVTGVGIESSDLPPFDEGRIDPRQWFAEDRHESALHIEVGSGKGTFLVQQAPLTPDVNYLGIEWAGEFYRYAADRVRRHCLGNVKLLRADAGEFIRFWVVDAVCDVLHIYFPDPWPKKRHHKRRLVQESTLAEFHRILTPGGEIRIVTDHQEYWEWMQQRFQQVADLFEQVSFESSAEKKADDHDEIVGTNFERKYRREGRPFYATRLKRLD